ncbi:MAG: geranylgeranyl reductase family protein [Candidatus Hydrogenedentota bacterium]
MIYDAIVIGAGPAGSTASRILANAGLKVLLIEKEKLPRYKPCAGGITTRTFQLIANKELNNLIKARVKNIEFKFKKFTRDYIADTEILMVDRKEFDLWLLSIAKNQGVIVNDNERVLKVYEGQQLVTVETIKGIYKSKFCIGADGGLSITRKCLKPEIEDSLKTQIGWATDIKISNNKNLIKSVMETGYIDNGYGWIFPKEEYLSCGVGRMSNRCPGIVRDTREFLSRMGMSYCNESIRGGGLACISKLIIPQITFKHTLLIGDAGFLVDPLSGEGIYQAIYSAKIAANVILKMFNEYGPDFSEYFEHINKEFYAEYKYANILADFMFRLPYLTYYFGIKNDYIVSLFEKLLKGEIRYSELFNNIREIVNKNYLFRVLYNFAKLFLK